MSKKKEKSKRKAKEVWKIENVEEGKINHFVECFKHMNNLS